MKILDYDFYKSVYCSLCKKLGKSYGILSRFTLSYDFTFLSVLNISLSDSCPTFKKGRCAFNPLKKCNYCSARDTLDYPAASAMIMLYYKILDNIEDSKGIKKIGYKIIRPLFARAHKKAAADFPQTEKAVAEYISAQTALENRNENQIDAAADPTAKALSVIFADCSNNENQRRVLSRLGYCIGRYIYLLDAAVDFEKDRKSKNYNVLCNNFSDREAALEKVKPQLYFCINEAKCAAELLDVKRLKNIIDNVIYLGLEDTFIKELSNEQSV